MKRLAGSSRKVTPRRPVLRERQAGTASIAAVAKLASVSNATVSRVLNGHQTKVSEETRKRVKAAIKALDYLPSRAGSALRSGRSHMVALILPDRFNSYNQGLAAALERAVRRSGKIMVLCTTDESPAMQDEVLREMRSQLACGIVLLGAVKSPGLRQALAGGEPIVLVNRRFGGRLACPFVGVDNATAAGQVAEELARRGTGRVAIVHGPLSSSATHERVSGFRARFAELVPNGRIEAFALARFTKEEGYRRAQSLLAGGDRLETVFCTSDEIAYGVARACREAGLTPGQDVTLFGFDGSPINEFLTPWLSTIQVAYDEYGPAIVSLLQGYWEGRAPPRQAEILVSYSLTLASALPAATGTVPKIPSRRPPVAGAIPRRRRAPSG